MSATSVLIADTVQKLQRAIAESRGQPPDKALVADSRKGSVADRSDDSGAEPRDASARGTGHGSSSAPGSGTKRKYRRHPKVSQLESALSSLTYSQVDANAPERPPSAYVIFSNRMRFSTPSSATADHWLQRSERSLEARTYLSRKSQRWWVKDGRSCRPTCAKRASNKRTRQRRSTIRSWPSTKRRPSMRCTRNTWRNSRPSMVEPVPVGRLDSIVCAS